MTVYKRLHTDLFAVRGHQVEATGGDIQVDGHASKLQVALPQDTGQSFGWWLKGSEKGHRDTNKQIRATKSMILVMHSY